MIVPINYVISCIKKDIEHEYPHFSETEKQQVLMQALRTYKELNNDQ